MPSKKNQRIPLPNDVGNSFEDDFNILNFRPTIEFVSPDLQPSEPGPKKFVEDDIATAKQDTEDLIEKFDAVVELIDIAQLRLDERLETLGGMDINLDERVDYNVIAAMKRFFPNEPVSNKITYEQYKQALKTLSQRAKQPPTFGPLDLRLAQENPFKTDFGALGLANGLARPEIASSAGVIEPISIPEFVAAAVIGLFSLLINLITGLIKDVVGL